MTTEAEINKQIEGDYNRFYSSVFDGKLPDDLIERFKKSLMAVPPGVHKYKNDVLKKMIVKRVDELSYMELGLIINLIFAVPFEKLYDSLEEGLDKNIELETIREKFNKDVEDTQSSLTKKKQTLMRLSGVNNSAPFKLIKAEA